MYYNPQGLLVGSNPGVIGEKNYPHTRKEKIEVSVTCGLLVDRMSAFKPGFVS